MEKRFLKKKKRNQNNNNKNKQNPNYNKFNKLNTRRVMDLV